ncbi:MAG: GyrI-like domain-containing protein [Oscillospiraceae bacterium]|jgi:hypothetical protein|nr:GyrI-like domain-containing protein [Oscillospiraceae bacterium]
MQYTVRTECLPEKPFLVIPGFVVLGDESDTDQTDSIADSIRMLGERILDGSVERLRQAAGSDTVYTLFCRSCAKLPGRNAWACGYDIACENANGAAGGEGFALVRLAPSAYAVFDCYFDRGTAKARAYALLNDLYWRDWLPKNPYISMIETDTGANTPGIASIELSTPLDPQAEEFRIQSWFPIRRKRRLFSRDHSTASR